MRNSNRAVDVLREIKITKDFNIHAEGSVLIEVGNTKVICTATVIEKVPMFLKNKDSEGNGGDKSCVKKT